MQRNEATSTAPTRPCGAPSMHMSWRSLLFMHWPVPASQLRPLVPDTMEIDSFDGSAWVGLVPFTMAGVGHRWMPRRLRMPWITDFHECNVRTYVTVDGEPGVWFFSLDAASPLAVWAARTFWNLPYYNAAIQLARQGSEVRYAVKRRGRGDEAALRCAWRVGDPLPPSRPGELAHFLTERYLLFAHRGDRTYRGRIWHQPWPLREGKLLALEDTLVAGRRHRRPPRPAAGARRRPARGRRVGAGANGRADRDADTRTGAGVGHEPPKDAARSTPVRQHLEQVEHVDDAVAVEVRRTFRQGPDTVPTRSAARAGR